MAIAFTTSSQQALAQCAVTPFSLQTLLLHKHKKSGIAFEIPDYLCLDMINSFSDIYR